uniref:Putative conserved secreted protein ovary overexpressed n=1 Tax=Rhipicephalus microplus TaxID=6941 RepID=A0A6M2D4H7_RHIMP
MRSPGMYLQFIAALLAVQSASMGGSFLPVGGLASATNGIVGFKISMATSLLFMLTQSVTGTSNVQAGTAFVDAAFEHLGERSGRLFFDMMKTTEKTGIDAPLSPLHHVINFDDHRNEQIAVLFAFLKELNDRGCVSRIVCESTAGTTRFGMLGNVTKDFFDTNAGVTTGAVSGFVAAARTGRSEGIAGCAQAFRECTADLPYVLRSVELM